MKKTVLFVLVLCLCFAVFGASFAEPAATEAAGAEATETEMTAEELCQAGKDAKNAGDYAKALDCYQRAAELGDSEAIKEIGNMYAYGIGVDVDDDKAFEYYQRAADLGNFNAINNLGNCYMDGRGAGDCGRTV